MLGPAGGAEAASRALPLGPPQNVHQFSDLLALFLPVATRNGMFDAVSDMIAENLFLGATERSADRRNLRNYVDAVPVFLDHAAEAPNLAFDAVKPFEHGSLGFSLHD